jgi:hypothetical protein
MPRYRSMDRQMLPLRYGSSAWVDESGELQMGGWGEEEER